MRKWTAANGRCEQSRFPAAGWSRNFPLCTKRNPDRQLACQTSSTPVYPPTSIERHLCSCCLQDTELHSATGGSRRRNCDTPKTKIACHFPQPSRQPPQAEEERAASTINHVGLLAARQSHGGHARRRRLLTYLPTTVIVGIEDATTLRRSLLGRFIRALIVRFHSQKSCKRTSRKHPMSACRLTITIVRTRRCQIMFCTGSAAMLRSLRYQILQRYYIPIKYGSSSKPSWAFAMLISASRIISAKLITRQTASLQTMSAVFGTVRVPRIGLR